MGKTMVSILLDYLQAQGIDWIRLICDPELEEFYGDLRFKKTEELVMVYEAPEKS
ncbi:MAG: hypothetical protein HQM12_13230 [SAR324 cluster bacterium]|nr:hypothetical protein [SAR324 cluster bacterium]